MNVLYQLYVTHYCDISDKVQAIRGENENCFYKALADKFNL